MVREIDDRYPEIARPYEPVKGGKHHKRIKLPPFTALIGTVLLMPLIYYPGTETSQPEPVTPESETVLLLLRPQPLDRPGNDAGQVRIEREQTVQDPDLGAPRSGTHSGGTVPFHALDGQ